MNAEELNRLIEKYYEGESTEEEENILREYFNGNNIPEDYQAEKVIFGYYLTAGEAPEPSIDFEARILGAIDASDKRRISQNIRRSLIPYLSAAAGLLILAGSFFFFNNRTEPQDTFSDPEIAYTETMKILMDVSSQLNHGARTLERSFETINTSIIIIRKNLKNLDYIQKEIEIIDVPATRKINK